MKSTLIKKIVIKNSFFMKSVSLFCMLVGNILGYKMIVVGLKRIEDSGYIRSTVSPLIFGSFFLIFGTLSFIYYWSEKIVIQNNTLIYSDFFKKFNIEISKIEKVILKEEYQSFRYESFSHSFGSNHRTRKTTIIKTKGNNSYEIEGIDENLVNFLAKENIKIESINPDTPDSKWDGWEG